VNKLQFYKQTKLLLKWPYLNVNLHLPCFYKHRRNPKAFPVSFHINVVRTKRLITAIALSEKFHFNDIATGKKTKSRQKSIAILPVILIVQFPIYF